MGSVGALGCVLQLPRDPGPLLLGKTGQAELGVVGTCSWCSSGCCQEVGVGRAECGEDLQLVLIWEWLGAAGG